MASIFVDDIEDYSIFDLNQDDQVISRSDESSFD